MPIVVNTNTSATTASSNLSRANYSLRKSLARLSSGNRIVSPEDDAGGLAVAYKISSNLKRDYPTVSTGARTEGAGAALWNVGGTPELQVLPKADIQTEGNNWRIHIRDDMPGTTGGMPSLGIGLDPKDTLKTLFTMDLSGNLGNYDYDFLETYAPDYFQVSLHASTNLIKFAESFNLSSQGSLGNRVLAPTGANPGAQDVWGGSLRAGLSYSGFSFWGDYVPVPTSGGSGSGSGGSSSGSGNSGPLTTTRVASTAVENDEVFTDDDFLQHHVRLDRRIHLGHRKDSECPSGKRSRAKSLEHEQRTADSQADQARSRSRPDHGCGHSSGDSTRFAHHNMLVQASATMTTQANQPTNIVLTFLG